MYEDILVALVTDGIRFVVIGGVAATIQGSARFTNDIDFCYDTATDNVERLAARLAQWNAYLRGVERGLPFIMDAKAFRITPVMTLTTDVGDIDVMDLVPGVGGYADAMKVSEVVEIGDGRVQVTEPRRADRVEARRAPTEGRRAPDRTRGVARAQAGEVPVAPTGCLTLQGSCRPSTGPCHRVQAAGVNLSGADRLELDAFRDGPG